MHCYQSHVPSIWPRNRSKSSKATHKHYKAHFVPFPRSNMAVFRARGGQNTLEMHHTYPTVLHIPPICIATSHMFHPLGLEIAHFDAPGTPASAVGVSRYTRQKQAKTGQKNTKRQYRGPQVLHIPPKCSFTSHITPTWHGSAAKAQRTLILTKSAAGTSVIRITRRFLTKTRKYRPKQCQKAAQRPIAAPQTTQMQFYFTYYIHMA